MDTQIWYAIFSTLLGGVIGAFDRLGEVSLMTFSSLISLILYCNNTYLFNWLAHLFSVEDEILYIIIVTWTVTCIRVLGNIN